MKASRLVSLGFVLLLAVSCSKSGSGANATPTAADTTQDPSKAQSIVLVEADFPTGWTGSGKRG
ncbi:MAG: hypothetical protein ABR552_07905 [Actinomycetota bacterium]|nr:hypothetical protein [Actinomycetota bacterium]